ncbi:UNVERIFIED_CONTAM: hypothetical protein Slati_3437800 [Sesamum latifolium]|uniref:Uncharacterized protein n=1 Tax=Sesamum latifolium TaxID=2727402 RepID=A0AAW2UGG3_9LAMI
MYHMKIKFPTPGEWERSGRPSAIPKVLCGSCAEGTEERPKGAPRRAPREKRSREGNIEGD